MRHLLPWLSAFLLLSWSPFSGGVIADEAPAAKPGDSQRFDDKHVITGEKHFISGYPARFDNGDVNVVVEIPAGSVDKWEVDKTDGKLKWEYRDGAPRRIRYLSYPANYGMIPQTVLAKEDGGDGDPLDVIVLGEALPRGTVVRCRLIGSLRMLDSGEADDKLLAVRAGTPFADIQTTDELQQKFPGALQIVQTWFQNYKGPGEMEFLGLGDKQSTAATVEAAFQSWKKNQNTAAE